MASAVTGYASGAARRRNRLSLVVLPLLIAIAVAVVADLDRPRLGFIRLHQGSMERLRDALHEATPPRSP